MLCWVLGITLINRLDDKFSGARLQSLSHYNIIQSSEFNLYYMDTQVTLWNELSSRFWREVALCMPRMRRGSNLLTLDCHGLDTRVSNFATSSRKQFEDHFQQWSREWHSQLSTPSTEGQRTSCQQLIRVCLSMNTGAAVGTPMLARRSSPFPRELNRMYPRISSCHITCPGRSSIGFSSDTAPQGELNVLEILFISKFLPILCCQEDFTRVLNCLKMNSFTEWSPFCHCLEFASSWHQWRSLVLYKRIRFC